MFRRRVHLNVHVCTMTSRQEPYYHALTSWLRRERFSVLVDSDAFAKSKLDDARKCDLCILLLGPDSGPALAGSSFTQTEMECSLAQDADPGKVLVFAQAEVEAPSSREQADFIERLRSFAGGTFQATCTTPPEFVRQVARAVAAWQVSQRREAQNALMSPPKAIMLSSTGDLVAERTLIRDALQRHRFPVIDYQVAASESTAPVERVVRWATECRVLVLVLGRRYGFISPVDGLGVTELEFVTALTHRRPIVAFFRDDAFTTSDPDQQQFVERVQHVLPATRQFRFDSQAELLRLIERVSRDLPRLTASAIPDIGTAQAERWYRRHLQRWLGMLPVPGQSRSILLDDMFLTVTTIPPESIPPPQTYLMGSLFVPDNPPDYPNFFPYEMLEQASRVWLTGGPGCGKSTVLHWLALSCARERLAVYLSLPRYGRMRLNHEVSSIGEFIDREEQRLLLASSPESARWNEALFRGQGSLLLDDLDAVPPQALPLILMDVQHFSHALPIDTPVVVAGRNGGEPLMESGFTRYVMAPLNQGQQQLLVEKWVRARYGAELDELGHRQEVVRVLYQLRVSTETVEWTTNPLLLGLFTAASAAASDVAPVLTPLVTNAVYRRALRALLLQSTLPHMLLCKEAFLQELAQRSMGDAVRRGTYAYAISSPLTQGELQETWDSLSAQVTQGCQRDAVLASLINANGLLVRREHEYDFLHHSFKAAVMAQLLSTHPERARLEAIVRHRLLSTWTSVATALASELDRLGRHEEANRLIETLMRADNAPIFETNVSDPLHIAAFKATYAYAAREEPFCTAEPGPTLALIWRQSLEDWPNSLLAGNALWMLYLLGPSSAPALDTLLKIFAEKDRKGPNLRNAEFALRRLAASGNSQAISVLQDDAIYDMHASSLGDRFSALDASLEQLLLALESPNARERFLAATELRKFGRLAQDFVPALISVLHGDESEQVRDAVGLALSSMGSASAVVPLVQSSLLRQSPINSYYACSLIKMVGPLAAPALPYVIEALESTDNERHYIALRIAAALGPLAAQALPILINMALRDEDPPLELGNTLIAIGGDQQSLLEGLQERLHSGDASLVDATLRRIASIGVPCAPLIDDVISVMEAMPVLNRGTALFALAKMKSATGPALSAIKEALLDSRTQWGALNAIRIMERTALPLVESVIPLIDAADVNVCRQALSAIHEVAPPPTPALLDRILYWLDHENQNLSQEAFRTTVHLRPLTVDTARRLIPVLAKHLNDLTYVAASLAPFQSIVDADVPPGVLYFK